MTNNKFYECDNPNCRLRFPGDNENPKWRICPLCRSSIHIVATVANSDRINISRVLVQPWRIEALLDNIRSTWNVGSIFRTSDGIGIQKLYLCGITATPENLKISKTALGAEKNVVWEKYHNSVELSEALKSKGKKLWVLEDLPHAKPLFSLENIPTDTPIVLIVGNEVSGVDPGIVELCDMVISIPMLGKKLSYNVAVAFGIATSFLLYRHSVSQGSDKILPKI